MFNWERFPYGMADYFGLRFPAIQSQPPFLKAERHPGHYPPSYSLPFSETYLSVTWASSWLVVGAILGLICLFRKGRPDLFEWGGIIALAVQSMFIVCYYTLAQRYSVDLYPFLIFCTAIFLRRAGASWRWACWLLCALILLSVTMNSLATASWLRDDSTLTHETRTFWNNLTGGYAFIGPEEKH
jgi:hypothetical protein